MESQHDCLHCGEAFTGRPNRAYCSTKCRDAAKTLRRRLAKVAISIDHTQRQLKVATMGGNAYTARHQSWRLRQLQAEHAALESRV